MELGLFAKLVVLLVLFGCFLLVLLITPKIWVSGPGRYRRTTETLVTPPPVTPAPAPAAEAAPAAGTLPAS